MTHEKQCPLGNTGVQPPTAQEIELRAPRTTGFSSAPESSSPEAKSLHSDSLLFPQDLAQLARGFSYFPQVLEEAAVASDFLAGLI